MGKALVPAQAGTKRSVPEADKALITPVIAAAFRNEKPKDILNLRRKFSDDVIRACLADFLVESFGKIAETRTEGMAYDFLFKYHGHEFFGPVIKDEGVIEAFLSGPANGNYHGAELRKEISSYEALRDIYARLDYAYKVPAYRPHLGELAIRNLLMAAATSFKNDGHGQSANETSQWVDEIVGLIAKDAGHKALLNDKALINRSVQRIDAATYDDDYVALLWAFHRIPGVVEKINRKKFVAFMEDGITGEGQPGRPKEDQKMGHVAWLYEAACESRALRAVAEKTLEKHDMTLLIEHPGIPCWPHNVTLFRTSNQVNALYVGKGDLRIGIDNRTYTPEGFILTALDYADDDLELSKDMLAILERMLTKAEADHKKNPKLWPGIEKFRAEQQATLKGLPTNPRFRARQQILKTLKLA